MVLTSDAPACFAIGDLADFRSAKGEGEAPRLEPERMCRPSTRERALASAHAPPAPLEGWQRAQGFRAPRRKLTPPAEGASPPLPVRPASGPRACALCGDFSLPLSPSPSIPSPLLMLLCASSIASHRTRSPAPPVLQWSGGPSVMQGEQRKKHTLGITKGVRRNASGGSPT